MAMEPVKHIVPQSWMKSDQARALMDVMNAGGDGAPQALFVGGCVRNALIGADVSDLDIATTHTPDQVQKLLGAAGIKNIPTGIDHGTITAVMDDQIFEITTLRKDIETDGRHAVVAYTKDWAEDAKRRDFTMNTLLADAHGNVYDPLGVGLEDLEARQVIFVGEPASRIQEDYLRILRFFRFHVFYGEGDLNAEGLRACAQFADKIKTLSKERITQEFFKILSADDPVSVLDIMIQNKVLPEILDEKIQLETLRYFIAFQNRYGLSAFSARLYVLVGMDLQKFNKMNRLLIVPKVFSKDAAALDLALSLPDLSDDHAVKVSVYKAGRSITAQTLMIELATDRVMNVFAPQALKIIQEWDIPNFPLSGDDLINKEGFQPGPALGDELDKREEAWIKNGFAF